MNAETIVTVLTADTRAHWRAQCALTWFARMQHEIIADGGDFIGRQHGAIGGRTGSIALIVLGQQPNCDGATRVRSDNIRSIVFNWLQTRRIDDLQYSPNLHAMIFGDE
jgi:hypothetical protein